MFPEDPKRATVYPGRLILGPFAPIANRFARLPYIPDAPSRLRSPPRGGGARKPNPATAAIPRDTMEILGDWQSTRPAGFRGNSAQSRPIFADFRTFPTRRSESRPFDASAPDTVRGDRLGVSISPEHPRFSSAVDMGRTCNVDYGA